MIGVSGVSHEMVESIAGFSVFSSRVVVVEVVEHFRTEHVRIGLYGEFLLEGFPVEMPDFGKNRIIFRVVDSRIDYLFYGSHESHGFGRLGDEMKLYAILHDLRILMDVRLTAHIGRGFDL